MLFPSCPGCPASQWRCSETQHTKWDVTCAAILFYLYWMGRHWGRDAKKRSPADWWGLVALQAQGGGCVIFTVTSKGVRETSPPLSPSLLCSAGIAHLPPKGKEKQQIITWCEISSQLGYPPWCGGVTELIFDCGFEDMQQGYCVDVGGEGALLGVME